MANTTTKKTPTDVTYECPSCKAQAEFPEPQLQIQCGNCYYWMIERN